MKQAVVQKNLRFPTAVIEILEKEGKKYGFSFNEYVKYLAIKKAEELAERRKKLHDELVKDIIEAEKLSKQNKLPTTTNRKEIEDYINSVMDDDEQI